MNGHNEKNEIIQIKKQMNHFISKLGHDLKGPVRSLYTLAGWIYEDNLEQLDEEGRENVLLLREKAYELQSLIGNILDLGRVEFIDKSQGYIRFSQIINRIIIEDSQCGKWDISVKSDSRFKCNVLRIEMALEKLLRFICCQFDQKSYVLTANSIDLENEDQIKLQIELNKKLETEGLQDPETMNELRAIHNAGEDDWCLMIVKKIMDLISGKLQIIRHDTGIVYQISFPRIE